MSDDVVLAIDAGGTKLLGGLVTGDGEVLATDEVPTPRRPEGCDPGLRALAELAARLSDTARPPRTTGSSPSASGFPEYVRDDAVTSAEVFAWDRQPAEVLADVRARRPGDRRGRRTLRGRGGGAGQVDAGPGSSLFYVSWGTGLSSSLVLGGTPLPGRRGEALALGEWPVPAAVDSRVAGEPRAVRRRAVARASATAADRRGRSTAAP